MYLSNIQPGNPEDSYIRQTEECLNNVKNILEQNDMSLISIVRTWFYNNDILKWYSQFNKVRSKFYLENGLIDNLVPASTGIGGYNPFGKALILSLLAVKTNNPLCRIREVDSPLQSTAQAYGSTFSRAVEITTPSLRRLYISGTTSIDKSGSSIHKTDSKKQIEYTLEVVKGILESNKMGYSVILEKSRIFHYLMNIVKITIFLICKLLILTMKYAGMIFYLK